MSNHYHLAVKTPEPNLVDGMRWLQSTFATRFNRFTGERGHVFQGRYKSLIVEEDRPLLGLVDYVHLNPVRAKLCSIAELKHYQLSSYPKFWKRKLRSGLDRSVFLSHCGATDSISGMKRYERHLSVVEGQESEASQDHSSQYSRGWFIGNRKAKNELAKRLVAENLSDWEGVDFKELNETKWEQIVKEEMSRLKVNSDDLQKDIKGAAWKIEIAKRLRKETTAGNPWIAKRLKMGHPNYVSNLVNK